MRFFIPVLIAVILAIAGCTERIDYDIEDVAPAEHLSGEGEHIHGEEEHIQGEEEHLHGEEEHQDECCVEVHEETSELEGIHADVHMHESGVMNHCTEWFFNQPWAASFVWGKMLRDTIVLLLLATALFLIPRIRSRRQK